MHLLDDPERCGELAKEGRRLVEEHYGWDALASKFEKFVHRVTGPVPYSKPTGNQSGRGPEN